MIKYVNGNIFESVAQAIINTVNLQGVMGKGLALQFKKLYPDNFRIYKSACQKGDIGIGKLLVVDNGIMMSPRYIINFPTKDHWRNPSKYQYIYAGLEDLKRVITEYGLTSVAIPPLGSGNGGLEWAKVRGIIEESLKTRVRDKRNSKKDESAA